MIPEIKNKTILIAPLDWGLGHAARCVPLIKYYAQNNTVIVGFTTLTKSFLETELKGLSLKWVELPSYNITYSKFMPVWLKILMQYFKIKKIIKREHVFLKKYLSKSEFDLVISDSRFGFYSTIIECVFLTHQLQIKAGVFSSLATKINSRYLKNFSNVWIMDNEKSKFAGDLSKVNLDLKIRYIGPQSRLVGDCSQFSEKRIETLILLSGIEPQRTILEEKLVKQFSGDKNVFIVRGTRKKVNFDFGNISVTDIASANELQDLILHSNKVICRSGYSTLMDLNALNFEKSNLILIPTPGQTEQEYLAKWWKANFNSKIVLQSNINTIN